MRVWSQLLYTGGPRQGTGPGLGQQPKADIVDDGIRATHSYGAGGTVTAPSRAQIINLSLGGPGPASAVLTAAVQAASAAGSLLIAAAGNDGGNEPNYPAAFPEVLSVSAVGPTGGIASFSSWGSTVDIAAPGGNGAGGYTHQILSTLWDFGDNSETWDYYQGTSMAAPHVSGVAALILAKEPTLTAAQLRQRLIDYAVPAGEQGHADPFGRHLSSARPRLHVGAVRGSHAGDGGVSVLRALSDLTKIGEPAPCASRAGSLFSPTDYFSLTSGPISRLLSAFGLGTYFSIPTF